jgi:LmbE family N-acetylglucosaminyl deacetylase
MGSSNAGVSVPFDEMLRNVLICAAHSDDCVIVGAEYGIKALAKGFSVRVIYLTCSAERPDLDIARRRREEAVSAWALLGVPETHLMFLDLPQSPVEGPRQQSDQELRVVERQLVQLIESMPSPAALIVPAAGESHVDHRTLRRVALEALRLSRRLDVTALEAPEYNTAISVARGAGHAFRVVLRSFVPLAKTVINPYVGSAHFVNKGALPVFACDAAAVAIKCELLRQFESQNADDILISSFGHATPYRCVTATSDDMPWTFGAFGGRCDWSSLLLALGISAGAILVGALGGAMSRQIFEGSLVVAVAGALTLAVLTFAAVRRLSLAKAVFAATVLLGLLVGSLWADP